MAKPTLLLDAHLKALRLPTFLREYDKVARHCAQEGLDCSRYLFRLCELELLDREQRAVERRIKAARFPVLKSLETFEFRAIPSVNKRLVLELARSEYLDRRENVLALGNSGTGKTHSCALGFSWTLDCERVLAGGVSRWGNQIKNRRRRRKPEGRPETPPDAAVGDGCQPGASARRCCVCCAERISSPCRGSWGSRRRGPRSGGISFWPRARPA